MAGPVPNARSRRIEESATLAITARAAAMKRRGLDVVSLGAGEPDFPTPGPIAAAGIRAIEQGKTRYTAAAGLPELRTAGADWLRATFGLDHGPAEVMVCAGAKAALHMALDATVEPGDRVLILAPYWVSYPALVTMADGVPVVVPPVPERGFVHDADTIAAAARQHGARGLILNYPNNPSGAVPTRAQLQAIVDAARAHDLWLLSDEIYGSLLYDGAEHVSPATLPGGRERTMVVSGFTKSHTMTGWRTSFLAAPQAVIDACSRIQSQVLGNPCTISQEAMLEACRTPLPAEHAARMQAFGERRAFLLEALAGVPGLALEPPRGAFYALVDARELGRRRGLDDVAMAEQLLERHLLAVVPGSAFAIPGFLRLSYAVSMPELQQAVTRLRDFAEAR
ncbi:MAG: pyridoxal phosphate-dependent aminotransferase [Planctomycetes bacterium]|nr:pyridoxal phosphate-dependent aminotransferase [Planctomycetota bacterium]